MASRLKSCSNSWFSARNCKTAAMGPIRPAGEGVADHRQSGLGPLHAPRAERAAGLRADGELLETTGECEL